MPEPIHFDTLFRNATLVTMDSERHIFRNACLGVEKGAITLIGAEAPKNCMAEEDLDLSGKVLMPGLINTHGHIAMALFRGYADDLSLENWLAEIWKLEAKTVGPQSMRIGTDLGICEMIKSGTTCAADMYFEFETNCQAAIETGFRLFNGPSFAVIPGFEHHKDKYYDSALEKFARFSSEPLIHLCVQAHSTYTASLQMLEEIARLQDEYKAVFVTHAAESKGEMEMVRTMYQKTPIQVLDSVGLINERSLLVHCVHLSDEEIALLAARGSSVAHCPQSNLKLASGIARVADLVKAGVNVSLGTDGCASNNDLDLLHEAQTAALLQKGITGDPSVLPARQMMEMLTINAARSFGLADKIGSLEMGKQADLIILDLDQVNTTPCYDIYSQIVYASCPSNVRDSMVAGRWLMRDRQLLTLDESAVRAQANEIAAKIRA